MNSIKNALSVLIAVACSSVGSISAEASPTKSQDNSFTSTVVSTSASSVWYLDVIVVHGTVAKKVTKKHELVCSPVEYRLGSTVQNCR